MFDLTKAIRPNIQSLKAYQIWRDDYLKDKENIFLDNCENNFGSPLGLGQERYPSSSQHFLKNEIAKLKNVNVNQIVLGNGSDELIDLLIRACCEPRQDNILICEPTFGMFAIYAQLNNIAVVNIPLSPKEFTWNVEEIKNNITSSIKLIFICSPNNPTGTSFPIEEIETLAKLTSGFIVMDEAYIDFSTKKSAINLLGEIPNLIILQTFSKAWGLAGLRIGVAYSSVEMTEILNKIRPPFNISSYSQQHLLMALSHSTKKNELIQLVLQEKEKLHLALTNFSFVKHIVKSDANFFLIEVKDAGTLCAYLLKHKLLISNRNTLLNCENYVRISIGDTKENLRLLELLTLYENEL